MVEVLQQTKIRTSALYAKFREFVFLNELTIFATDISDHLKLEKPFLVHPQPNHNIQIHSTSSENEILNWQRGIASLFLFKQENIEVNESDVLGKCQTKYLLDHHGLHKTKEKCQSGNSEDDSVRNFHRFSVKSFTNYTYL